MTLNRKSSTRCYTHLYTNEKICLYKVGGKILRQTADLQGVS